MYMLVENNVDIIIVSCLLLLINLSINGLSTRSFYNTLAICWLYTLIDSIILNDFLSLCIIILLLSIVTMIDITKRKILKEHFHYEDIFLYSQVFRFPKFYIPFVGTAKFFLIAITITFTSIVIVYLCYLWRDPFNYTTFITNLILFVLLSLATLVIKMLYKNNTFKENIKDLGLIMSLLFYASQRTPRKFNPKISNLDGKKPKTILAIQSESFILTNQSFDYPDTDETIQGKLNVPCYGAYTMRSEFSFLTGISPDQLKYQSFNPYRKIYKHVSNSYIKQLKDEGYYCVVIHPFKKAFFNRNKVFNHLGFDEFIDESVFKKTDIFTPDLDLNEFVHEFLKTNKDRKLFAFIITIAGHGPYTLPRQDPKKYRAKSGSDEIDTYLDLNFKANEMLKSLLKNSNEDTLLIWYGDHKPSISEYNLSQTDYYKTDYFISFGENNNYYKNKQDIDVENLLRFSLDQYQLLK